MSKERRRVYYSGQVQGVGFRYTTHRLAQGFEVTGYVRNLDDGSVELLAEGEPAGLNRFLEAIETGSAAMPPRSGWNAWPACRLIPTFRSAWIDRHCRDDRYHPSSSLPTQNLPTMKSLTIGLATAKEAIRQPAFFVLAFLAGSSLVGSVLVSYFTFGEDINMYKDTGLTTISFADLLLALLTASTTVADEIEEEATK